MLSENVLTAIPGSWNVCVLQHIILTSPALSGATTRLATCQSSSSPLAHRGKIVAVVVVVVVFPFGRPTNRLVLNLWVQTLRALYESQSVVVVVVVTTRHNTRDSLSLFLLFFRLLPLPGDWEKDIHLDWEGQSCSNLWAIVVPGFFFSIQLLQSCTFF